jgi:hypothetical protein
MKIVGLFILIAFLGNAAIGADIKIGRFKCRSAPYARLDNGDMDIFNIETTYLYENEQEYYSDNNLPYLQHRKKSDKVTYLFAYDENEKFLFKRKINNNVLESHDLGFNKRTFFRFKDQSAVGINLVCRM